MSKILLVEDDDNLRGIYGDRLSAEGYEIVSARDGEEALAIAVNEKPDLIISDVMMPKISGFDMLDILRSTAETKNTKVIMMTALSQKEDQERGEALGANRYLVKSQVTLEDVVRVAAEVLAEDGPGPATPAAPAAPTAPPVAAADTATPAPGTTVQPEPAAASAQPVPETPAVAATPDDATTADPAPKVDAAPAAATPPADTTQEAAEQETKVDEPAEEVEVSAAPVEPAADEATNEEALHEAEEAVKEAAAETTSEEKQEVEEQIKEFEDKAPETVAATPEVAEESPAEPAPTTPEPAAEAPQVSESKPTAPPQAEQEAPQTNTEQRDLSEGQEATDSSIESATVGGTKVIEPINDVANQPPDINKLYEKELQKESSGGVELPEDKPPASPVKSPPPVDDAPKVNPNDIAL